MFPPLFAPRMTTFSFLLFQIVEKAVYTVYARLPNKKTIPVRVSNTDTVKAFRTMMESQEGKPTEGNKYVIKVIINSLKYESSQIFSCSYYGFNSSIQG